MMMLRQRLRWTEIKKYLPLAGALLVALVARLFRLTWPGLWTDEGFSILLAQFSLPDLVAGTVNDLHPPLFYMLLKLWLLPGWSEAYVRLFPVLWGVLTVALLYEVGRRLFDPVVGFWAAFYLALSPMHIVYSREIRMYVLFVFLSALSVYMAWCWAEDLFPGAWAGYVAATLLALYTQNMALLLLPFENILVLASLIRQKRWRSLPHWLAGQSLVFLGYLFWVPVLAYQLIVPQASWLVPGDLDRLLDTIPYLVFGEPRGPVEEVWPFPLYGQEFWQLAAYVLLLAVAVILPAVQLARRREWRWAGLFNGLWLLLVGGTLFWLSTRMAIYQEKQFLFMTVPLVLLLAVGTAAVPKWGRILVALAFLVLILPSLHNVYYRHQLADHPMQEAWDELAVYIDDRAQPGDAIVFNPGISAVMLDLYLETSLPYEGYPQLYDPHVGGLAGEPATPARLEAQLGPFIREYRRIWLVECCLPEFWDPQRCMPAWLEQWGRPVPLPNFSGLQVRLYEARQD